MSLEIISPYLENESSDALEIKTKVESYINDESHVNSESSITTESKNTIIPKINISSLVKLYRNIARVEKYNIWATNYESPETKLDMTFSELENINKTLSSLMNEEKYYHARVESIPLFINDAFSYLIKKLDSEAPIKELPNNMMKYNLICGVVGIKQSDEIYKLFRQCINDEFIIDLRIMFPPYYSRSTLTKKEIETKIKEVIEPMCKRILELLIKM
jgi:hypothetical protein